MLFQQFQATDGDLKVGEVGRQGLVFKLGLIKDLDLGELLGGLPALVLLRGSFVHVTAEYHPLCQVSCGSQAVLYRLHHEFALVILER
ncbi:hypothetical protein D9M71_721180 [compost metagenome]